MQTVYVGMSGGVDSSVTAALLKQQGYEVVGVYMKNWSQDILGFECPWRQDLTDAKATAAFLGITLKIYDFEDQYKQRVVDYMVAEYQSGRTPNPDIMCNQEIKFKLFLNTALEDGADLIATGHYARALRAPVKSRKAKVKNQSELYMGVDRNKDQSYFLYRVTGEALQQTLMPLGDLTKPAVRALAKKFNLPTADKKDSQGICFVGEVGIKEFLQQYISVEPGPIHKKDGTVLGEHEGAVFYTIGQRHGLGVGGGLPYYVVGKDMATNTVYVTDDLNDFALKTDQLTMTDLHWINKAPDLDKTYQVRTRYRGQLINCEISQNGNKLHLKLAEKDRAITPGQSAVLYDGDRVLGGGIITVEAVE